MTLVAGVVLDLDGTVVDTAPEVLEALGNALSQFDFPLPEGHPRNYLGSPLALSLQQMRGLPPSAVHNVIKQYDTLYMTLMRRSEIYPGMHEFLDSLSDAAIPVAIATVKPRAQALALLEDLGVVDLFHGVFGLESSFDLTSKVEVARSAMQHLLAAGSEPNLMSLVGDRATDVAAARALKIRSIYASWGYGSSNEAQGTGAVANSPRDLFDLVTLVLPRDPARAHDAFAKSLRLRGAREYRAAREAEDRA